MKTPTKIHFATGPCALGTLLVAQSDKGLCLVAMGDKSGELKLDLQKRFPRTPLIEGGGDVERLLAQVIRLVETPTREVNLPLDIRGTEFQRRVWQALREIPAGSTLSYGEIAKKIGAPRSVRAVGQACGANSLAVIIPCHRAVRSDGTLSGYRWGIERKRALLRRESAAEVVRT